MKAFMERKDSDYDSSFFKMIVVRVMVVIS